MGNRDGSFTYFDEVSIVPEPATMGLLITGGLVLGATRRRFRRV